MTVLVEELGATVVAVVVGVVVEAIQIRVIADETAAAAVECY